MAIKNKKREILKNKLAGIMSPQQKFFDIKNYENMLRGMKRDMFYRTRITSPSELMKAIDRKHAKQLRQQEDALGIRVYV